MSKASFESMATESMATDREAIARRRSEPKVKFYSNCWAWAIYAFLRRGGFLILTKSEWGWWPHVMWSPDMHSCHQFEPDHRRRWGRLFPPFIYRGYIKKTRL
jgi:hypothetical protein